MRASHRAMLQPADDTQERCSPSIVLCLVSCPTWEKATKKCFFPNMIPPSANLQSFEDPLCRRAHEDLDEEIAIVIPNQMRQGGKNRQCEWVWWSSSQNVRDNSSKGRQVGSSEIVQCTMQ